MLPGMRTLDELRRLRRGLIGLVGDQDPHLANLMRLFEECLTRLEENQALRETARSFRAVTEELRSAKEEAITKPIPTEAVEVLRKQTEPGLGKR